MTVVAISSGLPIFTSFDHQALDRAPEIASLIGEACAPEARATIADPGLGVEQNPFAYRHTRETHGEIPIDEGPLVEIEDRGDAVAEVAGHGRAHQRAQLLAGDQRSFGTKPDRRQTELAKVAPHAA